MFFPESKNPLSTAPYLPASPALILSIALRFSLNVTLFCGDSSDLRYPPSPTQNVKTLYDFACPHVVRILLLCLRCACSHLLPPRITVKLCMRWSGLPQTAGRKSQKFVFRPFCRPPAQHQGVSGLVPLWGDSVSGLPQLLGVCRPSGTLLKARVTGRLLSTPALPTATLPRRPVQQWRLAEEASTKEVGGAVGENASPRMWNLSRMQKITCPDSVTAVGPGTH